jgi:hypothetical protein
MPESKAFNYEDIDERVCLRCGLRTKGRHETPGDRLCHGCPCVDALRARIADLEFRLERAAQKRVGPVPTQQEPPAERRGGRRNRKDARMVILDGERLCITEAARRLEITASTLHFRLLARTKTKDYDGVDVRAVGADGARVETQAKVG